MRTKICLCVCALSLSGCAALLSNVATNFGNNLSSAIKNQDDPEMARAGMPSYILMLDSFLESSPDDPALLSAAATMYATYGAVFANDEKRAARLTHRARNYAGKAMCESYQDSCNWRGIPYDQFTASLNGVDEKNADVLFAYGFASLAYIRTHSDDWNALAELPQSEAIMTRYLEISGENTESSAHNYLGILMTIRPPALGGKPEEARSHFETAIAMSNGKDLSAKVEMLKGYARALYDRELNDQLCDEILRASPYADGFTLSNVLAQEEALVLCAEADDYF